MGEDLFSTQKNVYPLAFRMRPKTLKEFQGQHHILSEDSLLYKAISNDVLSSLILSGPPGSGKTTLAYIIAGHTSSHFVSMNAVLTGVQDLKKEMEEAMNRFKLFGKRTVIFVDEIHRWNKANQDALLYHVENGNVILIGATTENPFFSINSALLSRSMVFQLEPLNDDDLVAILKNAINDKENGYGRLKININDDVLLLLAKNAAGDARSVLNALEFIVKTTNENKNGEKVITKEIVKACETNRFINYDKKGDGHYDTISAFIKSMRGSDPDATLYYLARMILLGEDPSFIFRRMLILASEDVGMAFPSAVSIVEADARSFERVGFPEGKYHLAHAALFLALCPKSDSVNGYFDAESTAKTESKSDDVPRHLRDKHRDSDAFGDGEDYKYPHLYPNHYVEQQYLPSHLKDKKFYSSSGNGWEGKIRHFKDE